MVWQAADHSNKVIPGDFVFFLWYKEDDVSHFLVSFLVLCRHVSFFLGLVDFPTGLVLLDECLYSSVV